MADVERRRINGIEFEKTMELWVATPSKVRLAVFFRHNPGLVDTLEGIAARLAVSPRELAQEIGDHLDLGVVRQRSFGTTTVYAFDRQRAAEIEEMIAAAVAEKTQERA